jgi:hypothetical protein
MIYQYRDSKQSVDVLLYNHVTSEDIYWSPRKFRTEGGQQLPAGGLNSYVLVADETGPWLRVEKRVCLICVNGVGEIRWEITPATVKWDDEFPAVVAHFRLGNASKDL